MNQSENNISNKKVGDIPELIPPNTNHNPVYKEHNNQSLIIFLLTGVIISLLVIIIFILIKLETPQTIVTPEKIIFQDVSPVEKRSTQRVQQETEKLEQLITKWMLLNTEAEQQHFKHWAEIELAQARDEAGLADQFVRQSQYDMAEKSYQQAIAKLTQIKQSKSSRLNDNLEKADKALVLYDWKMAKHFYTQALQIDAENQRGVQGLNDAKGLSQVIALYEEASSLLIQNNEQGIEDYIEIKALLDKATNIYKEYPPVKQLKEQIQGKSDQMIFQQYITSGMNFLQQKDFLSAREALSKAKLINPNDPALSVLENKLILAEKNNQISILKTRAKQLENQERWSAAIDMYNQILSIEPRTSIAIQGKKQAETYYGWHFRLDQLINHPERLQSDKVRENATLWLNSVKQDSHQNSSKQKILQKKINTAERMIEKSKLDITVEFISDHETEVEIYKVGKLGRFSNKKVSLKPGKYTVLGSRLGYRDVRLSLLITAEEKNPKFRVMCKEMI